MRKFKPWLLNYFAQEFTAFASHSYCVLCADKKNSGRLSIPKLFHPQTTQKRLKWICWSTMKHSVPITNRITKIIRKYTSTVIKSHIYLALFWPKIFYFTALQLPHFKSVPYYAVQLMQWNHSQDKTTERRGNNKRRMRCTKISTGNNEKQT